MLHLDRPLLEESDKDKDSSDEDSNRHKSHRHLLTRISAQGAFNYLGTAGTPTLFKSHNESMGYIPPHPDLPESKGEAEPAPQPPQKTKKEAVATPKTKEAKKIKKLRKKQLKAQMRNREAATELSGLESDAAFVALSPSPEEDESSSSCCWSFFSRKKAPSREQQHPRHGEFENTHEAAAFSNRSPA
ncbi:MAG: hypothetical protein P4M14_08955 [Gammaproteobacteria bacterium]|nr:hypothetical protein [Gammaproteobacteria bacterium]